MAATREGKRAQELAAQFAAAPLEVEIECLGSGAHWQCRVTRGARACTASCFSDECYFTLESDGSAIASGRAVSSDEVVAACIAWLNGWSLALVYREFRFVDRWLRGLRTMQESILALDPRVAAHAELRPIHPPEFHELWYVAGDRACKIHFYGREPAPRLCFTWDETEMFSHQTSDTARVAALLARWLVERAPPSAIAAAFGDVRMQPVAAHYEAGRPIEGELSCSWDDTEHFFAELPSGLAPESQPLIRALRAHGFDRTLRAGTSLATLMLSRSRRHGLREEQPYVALHPTGGRIRVESTYEDARELWMDGVEIASEVLALLRRLEAEPIT